MIVSTTSNFKTGYTCGILNTVGAKGVNPEHVACRGKKGKFVTVKLPAEHKNYLTLCGEPALSPLSTP